MRQLLTKMIVLFIDPFAIESMALEKPVVCYLREDLMGLYKTAGLYSDDKDVPIISAHALEIKDVIRNLYDKKEELPKIGKDGREYVLKHHSIDAIAETFKNIFDGILLASNTGEKEGNRSGVS